MEGGVLFYAEQVAASKFVLQVPDGLHSVLVSGVEALRSRSVGYLEALVIVCIQGLKGVSVVSEDVEEVRYLVGGQEQLFVENILQKPHCPLQVLILLLGNGVAVNHITLKHILL